jgi:hypothetical protein
MGKCPRPSPKVIAPLLIFKLVLFFFAPFDFESSSNAVESLSDLIMLFIKDICPCLFSRWRVLLPNVRTRTTPHTMYFILLFTLFEGFYKTCNKLFALLASALHVQQLPIVLRNRRQNNSKDMKVRYDSRVQPIEKKQKWHDTIALMTMPNCLPSTPNWVRSSLP